MKSVLNIIVFLLTFAMHAQSQVMVFQSSNIELNKKGEKVLANNPNEITTLTIDLTKKLMTIETNNPDIIELMRKDMDRKVIKNLGDSSKEQFSLQLEDMMFVHFFLDKDKIILTRSDIHPLKWGIQLRDVIQREN